MRSGRAGRHVRGRLVGHSLSCYIFSISVLLHFCFAPECNGVLVIERDKLHPKVPSPGTGWHLVSKPWGQ